VGTKTTAKPAPLRVDRPAELMQRVADQAVALIPGASGALIALWDGGPVLTYVCGAGYLSAHVGLKLAVQGSLSGLCVRRSEVMTTADAVLDPRVAASACERLQVRSSICVPLVRDGRTFGVLNVSSPLPSSFTSADADTLADLAEFLGVVIGAAADLERATQALLAGGTGMPDTGVLRGSTQMHGAFISSILEPLSADHAAVRRRIDEVLDAGQLSMVFQPVVDLATGTVTAYEALARFTAEPVRTPDVWFAEAHEVGRGVALELAAVELALRRLHDLPDDCCLAINVGPETLAEGVLCPILQTVDAGRVVVELTEHAAVGDYPKLLRSLDDLRQAGVRLAVDDTGAGISSLAHILKLDPEVIKLDRALTSGIDEDPARRALAVSLVAFAGETGALIVAEGIETPAELDVLRAIGVRYGQGYHLGRPAPLV
jgi:EAL domain-containing protein (putative c-di-GMP-specific phosphodiesterase class I)